MRVCSRFLGIALLLSFCGISFCQDAKENIPPAENIPPTEGTQESSAVSPTEKAPSEPVELAAAEASETPKPDRSAFEAAVKKWQQVTSEYATLAIQWHMSQPTASDRETRLRWAELQDESRQAFRETVQEAMKVAEQGLARHPDISVFLLQSLMYRSERDGFEMSGDAIEVLMRNEADCRQLFEEANIDMKKIQALAGVSLFMTGQYDRAEKFLTLPEVQENLPDKYRGLKNAIPTMKERFAHELQMREADSQKGDLPRVKFTTSRGTVVFELFEDQAPHTVGNFISLVERGFYDDNPFYQVVKATLIMAGDPNGDGSGEAGYHIADEDDHPDARFIFRGTIAMAKLPDPTGEPGKTIPNSASSQFIIAMAPLSIEKSTLTAFGRVIEGMDTLVALTEVKVDETKKKGQKPPDIILKAEVLRKRDHPYVPRKVEFAAGHGHVH